MTATADVLPFRPRQTLGGSTAAAAAGVDPYCSRVRLWLEMTGRVTRDESEPMRWGTLLQPVIMGELAERGYIVEACADEYRDDSRPWLVGHPDGFVATDRAASGVLEIKTANAWAKWTERVPLAYEAQVQIYLHLTGIQHGVLACLVGGQRLEIRDVERSDRAIELLLALMDEFMEYVRSDTPPPPDGSQDARAALGVLYPEHVPEKVVRFTREQMALVHELRARREQLAAVKVQADDLENHVRAVIGDAEVAIGPHDEAVATWRAYDERRLDGTRLKKDLPDLAERYTNVTRRRRFTLA